MTYKEIQEKYKKKYGKTVKTCWIADVKRKKGYKVRDAYNRLGKKPKYPCPSDMVDSLSKIIG